MPRALAVMLLVFGTLHTYLWHRLVHLPAWPAPYGLAATLSLCALCVLIPMAVLVKLSERGAWGRALLVLGYTWLGMLLLLVVSVVAIEPVRWFYDAPRELALGALCLASALSGWALWTAHAGPRIKRVRVALSKLPRALDGTSIVQVSDVHIGPTVQKGRVQALVDKVNALSPDVIAITGDLVDGPVLQLRQAAEPLAGLESRYGTYFVTGNHEFYWQAEEWVGELARLGIRVLANERVRIGQGEASFELAGVHDPTAAHRGGTSSVAAACSGKAPGRELVLLSHQPSTIDEAAAHDVGLQLSGHTHGGQIWPFGWLVQFTQPYMRGLHRHGERTQIYVSCGTHQWGPPMRLGAPPEITRIELARGS